MVAIQSSGPKRGLLLLLSVLLWLSASVVLATPLGFASDGLERRKPGYPSLQDCKDKFKAPAKDKAMYFTGLKTKKDINAAKQYAVDHDMVHVGLSYPTSFTNVGNYEGTAAEQRTFQENFSKVYAEGTEGIAYLLIDDGKSPASDSIFETIEFQAMKDGGKVSKILRFPSTDKKPKESTDIFWPESAGQQSGGGPHSGGGNVTARGLDYKGPPPRSSTSKRSLYWDAAADAAAAAE